MVGPDGPQLVLPLNVRHVVGHLESAEKATFEGLPTCPDWEPSDVRLIVKRDNVRCGIFLRSLLISKPLHLLTIETFQVSRVRPFFFRFATIVSALICGPTIIIVNVLVTLRVSVVAAHIRVSATVF